MWWEENSRSISSLHLARWVVQTRSLSWREHNSIRLNSELRHLSTSSTAPLYTREKLKRSGAGYDPLLAPRITVCGAATEAGAWFHGWDADHAASHSIAAHLRDVSSMGSGHPLDIFTSRYITPGHLPPAQFSLHFCHAMLCISAAYAVMRCLSVCVSVYHVRAWILSKRINISSNFFSPSGNQAILVSPHRMSWRYSDGDPLTGRRMQVG